MAEYHELMAADCATCARRVVFVRVVKAAWPLLYDAATSWMASTLRHAWLAGAAVRIPWECQECGSPLAAPAATTPIWRRLFAGRLGRSSRSRRRCLSSQPLADPRQPLRRGLTIRAEFFGAARFFAIEVRQLGSEAAGARAVHQLARIGGAHLQEHPQVEIARAPGGRASG